MFEEKMRVCLFGASGGIGRAVAGRLLASPRVDRLYAGSRVPQPNADERYTSFAFDLEREPSIADAAQQIAGDGSVDLVIIATGQLQFDGKHPERSWKELERSSLQAAFAVNTIGPALIAKHFMPLLRPHGRAVFAALSAKVGSIEDNKLGGWHSYRASKAALNQIVRNLAIELKRTNPEAVAVTMHPGTVDTRLSQPFTARLPPQKLFSPDDCAARLLAVIDGLSPADSGHLIGWDGSQIPF